MAAPLADSLAAALAALADSLRARGIPTVIIGGIAASLLGRPRLTRDIDAMVDVPETDWQTILNATADYEITPRVERPLEFARNTRVLLLRHAPSQIDIDIVLAALPFEREAVASGQLMMLDQIEVHLPRIEDLMIMKAIAHRPRDLLDLEGLLSAHPAADIGRVRRCVREFATAATMPALVDDLEAVIQKTRSSHI